jgi:UPF0716 protein FxsA
VLLLVLLFIVVPIAELYVIIRVGDWIGVGPTLAILIFDSVLGALLLRHQGRAAWVRFNRALSESRMPGREVLDGVMIIFGGALLLTPGFITDVVGLLLLIPPTRAALRGLMTTMVKGRLAAGPRAAYWGYRRVRPRRPRPGPEPGWPPPGGPPGGPPPPGARPDDIEGTAHEVRDGDELEGGGPASGEGPPDRSPPDVPGERP